MTPFAQWLFSEDFEEALENAKEFNFSANATSYLLRTLFQHIRSMPEFKNPLAPNSDDYLNKIGEKMNRLLMPNGIKAGYDSFYGKFFVETPDGRRIYNGQSR